MAPRFSRRRDATPADDGADPGADLGAAEHAWWAQRDVEGAWTPRAAAPEAEPERDVLAEHFGDDWRTSFGLPHRDGPPPEEEPAEPFTLVDEPIDTSDPYAVLQVDDAASWEEIVAAHRRMARRHHPDRLVDRPAAEVAAAEERIRAINVAYQELRVRRGR